MSEEKGLVLCQVKGNVPPEISSMSKGNCCELKEM